MTHARQRATVLVALVLLAPSLAFAGPGQSHDEWTLPSEDIHPYDTIVAEFLAETGNTAVGDLTVAQLRDLTGALSVQAQQEDFIRRAEQSSRAMPGSGHFMVGADGRGALLTTSAVLVMAGTVVGAYFALPDGVQFGSVDYINDSFREINAAWRSESIRSMLPAAGVVLAGGVVHGILGEIASRDAGRIAREQITSGARTFEPQPFIFPDPSGRLMLGARIGY
tara:strand:- start:26 stop:697 length:672 start_codon:yes stop_codon:yes gene_type:complete